MKLNVKVLLITELNRFKLGMLLDIDLGPVVQNIVSLTSSLVVKMLTVLVRAQEIRKNSRSGPKLRILDRFQTPQNANKSVQQVP